MAHPFSDFTKFEGTPFEAEILPIIPAAGPLDETISGLSADHLGKIPGRYSKQTKRWTGFHGWQKHWTKPTDLRRWQGWQGADQADTAIAIALNTREYLAVDIDIDDEAIADQAQFLVTLTMASPPIAIRRRHGSARRVLIYARDQHDFPIRKHRIAFKVGDQLYAVEFLGEGQQVIIEGPHAKGAMHYWHNDVDLLTGLKVSGSLLVCPADVGLAVKTLKEWVEREGWELVKASGREIGARDPGAAYDINNPVSPHIAKDRALLTQALQAIDLDDPRIDYDMFISLLRAACAAVSGDLDYLLGVVWPWVCTNQKEAHGQGPRTQDRGIEWLEERWRSFRDSELGADYVYRVAGLFGFREGSGAIAEDIVAAAGSVEGAEEEGGGGSEDDVGGGNSGPLAAGDTDEAIAAAFIQRFGDTWRYSLDQGWVRRENGIFVPDTSIVHDIGVVASAEGDRQRRTQGAGGAVIDKALKGAAKRRNVEYILKSSRELIARPEQFDADPWLLNTPDYVLDLRTLESSSHSGSLMRMQTAVSPNALAIGDYENACPQWMAYIRFVAAGDERYVRCLRRWGAYSFIGAIYDQLFLFIYGIPNSGKSVFLDVLSRLQLRYSASVSKTFFIRLLDKRTFELFQLIGKRSVFGDEVPRGSTWDEMMILTMLSGTLLRAEGKGRPFAEFRNTATITIAGNHKPQFVTTAEKSGIDRRLLMLEFKRRVDEVMKDDRRFAEKLVEQEGAAILMWFIEEAKAGWESLERDGSFMGDTIEVAQELAKEYRRGANAIVQWITEEMQFELGAKTKLKRAFELYMEWQRVQSPRHKETLADYRAALELLHREDPGRNPWEVFMESGNAKVDPNVLHIRNLRERRTGENFQVPTVGGQVLSIDDYR